jgi:hypothetical protein
MDDPNLSLADGFLSYDEQPSHSVTLAAFSMMSNTLSQEGFAESGIPGDVSDVSHTTALAFAAWYTKQQQDGYTYRLPTEQEWEYVRKLKLATAEDVDSISFSQREHITDWHNVYPDPPLVSSAASPSSYTGPANGILKVVRDGSSASPTTRYALPAGATHAAIGFPVTATTFRLVKVRKAAAGAETSEAGAQTREASYSPGSFSQVGIIPTGVVSATADGAKWEPVDVSKLGPPANVPLCDVRMVLPVPPDSEVEGTASLTGLDPATMYHSHSPGLEVMKNGDVLAVWFTSAAGHGEPGIEASINSRMVQARYIVSSSSSSSSTCISSIVLLTCHMDPNIKHHVVCTTMYAVTTICTTLYALRCMH